MILMSWIFFSCVTQSMFSSHLDMTLSSLTNVRSSAWSWVWCSPELVTFSFNGCCSLWCSPANIVIIMIINLHNKAWFSSVVWKSSSELSRLWSANFKREQDGKGGMKVGDEYVSYYHPLSFVNMTTFTTITTVRLIILFILKPWLFIQPFAGIVRLKVTSRSDVERCRLISWKRSFYYTKGLF